MLLTSCSLLWFSGERGFLKKEVFLILLLARSIAKLLPLGDMDMHLFGLEKYFFFILLRTNFASAAVLPVELSVCQWKDWLLPSLRDRSLHLSPDVLSPWTPWNIAAPLQESWPCCIEINGDSYNRLQQKKGQA